jgi:pilus assembly protein CpaC
MKQRLFGSVLLGLLSAVLVMLSGVVISEEDYESTVNIIQGQTRLMPYPNVTRVSIGHPDIANAQATGPGEILLTGLKAGVTDLRIWTSSGSQKRFLLKVTDNTWVQILEVANIVLADVEGVNAREENGVVFIEGRILREQDIPIIEDLRSKMQKELQSGTVVFNVMTPKVSLQAMIMLDVQVVEVRRDDLLNLGIAWSESAPGPFYEVVGEFTGAGNFEKYGSFFGFGWTGDPQSGAPLEPLTEITSTINLLQTKGVARVLAQPKLVTKSGSKAKFLAGGEIPIPIRGGDGELTVEFKQVGVILDFSPIADPDGFIATKINVEVSAVDRSVEVLGIPGFTTRKTDMEMNAQAGQTMVISGMLQAEDSKAIGKVPGLGSIPIIGELFKSRNFQQKTTELVIFVTPFLVDPDSKRNTDMIEYSKQLSRDAEDDMRFSIFD